MAKEHAKAVRDSDLYEHGGLRKPLLEKIALLIIRPLEENETPPDWWRDDFVGWCVLPQERIAAELGCSVEQVCRNIALFVKDGWVTIDTYEAADGSEHNKYAITPVQMKEIRNRKMKVDDRRHFIRGRSERKSRKSKKTSMDNLVWSRTTVGKTDAGVSDCGEPIDTQSKGLMTRSQEGGCVGVKGLLDTESIESSGNPSFIGKKIAQKEKATPTPRENPASLPTKERKENQSQPRERQGNPIPAGKTTPVAKVPRPPRVAAFKPEVESQFRAAGAPDLWFEAMAPLTDTIDMLNGETLCGCPYPVKSWLTISLNHPNWKASQLWVPKITESGDIAYSEANSLADQIFFRRMNEKMTDAEREVNRARFWWGKFTLEQMFAIIPHDTWTTHKDGIAIASEAAILGAYRQAKGVNGTKVEAAVVEEREYVPVDDI